MLHICGGEEHGIAQLFIGSGGDFFWYSAPLEGISLYALPVPGEEASVRSCLLLGSTAAAPENMLECSHFFTCSQLRHLRLYDLRTFFWRICYWIGRSGTKPETLKSFGATLAWLACHTVSADFIGSACMLSGFIHARYPTLCDPMDHSPQGPIVYGVLQERILEWVMVPSSRGSSQPRDWTHIPYAPCIGKLVLYH